MKNFCKTFKVSLYKYPVKQFSWFSNIKRHFDSLIEPGHYERTSAIYDSNLQMHTHMRQFQAFLTKNAFDMAVNNEYDLWPHTNFGTIDNPALIFSANTTWRMVICTGPGSEEESSGHEKMYMIVREGPIHRCIMCGQCFKLVNLKDDLYDPQNSYYSSVFTEVSPKVIGEQEQMPYLLNPFVSHDNNLNQSNILPANRYYTFVNADEADHIMVDPAYRMQKYKEIDDYYHKIQIVNNEVLNQYDYIKHSDRDKIAIPKDIYETWYKVEKAMRKFDRTFNRYEKFVARSLYDPENHARREKRMNERKDERNKNNYAFFFGDLTETEQQYRDYYETDVEETNEFDLMNELKDDAFLRETKDFNMNSIEFIESSIIINDREPVQDIVEKQLFKYRYRKLGDLNYPERNERVMRRCLERTKNKKTEIPSELAEILEKHHVDSKLNFKQLFDKADQVEGLKDFLNYVADEGFNQFMDYYEDDIDMKNYSKYFNDLSIREKIRFAEAYDNHINLSSQLESSYVLIPKRPYDEKKSVARNFAEDLIDFNSRVRPIMRNLAFLDSSSKYQPLTGNANNTQEKYKKVLDFKKVGNNYFDKVKDHVKL
jgi:hypothetical protein